MKKFFIILIVLIAAFGCKDSEEKTKLKYCENQLKLISAPINLKEISFNFNQTGKECIKEVETKLGVDICDSMTLFGIPFDIETVKLNKTKNSIALLVRTYKECEVFPQCLLHNYFEILYNSNHQLLIEGEFSSKKDIKNLIPKFYAENNDSFDIKPNRSSLFIQWDNKVNKDSLSSIFQYIIEGYFSAVNQYSLKKYNLDICSLSHSQIDSLQLEFPFNLELFRYANRTVPPVPPPFKEIESLLK